MDAKAYLKSGTNELKILEFMTGGVSYGLNILKTSRVLSAPDRLSPVVKAHPAIRGLMVDHGTMIPVIDLAQFLGTGKACDGGRILVTEFFGTVNGFLIDSVRYVHTILWERVFDAHEIMGAAKSDYVIGIVRPTEKAMILLLDYEKIILQLAPALEKSERQKIAANSIDGRQRPILIAEDSAAVRDMLAVELSGMGFEIIATKDGVQALNMIKQRPDIALLISDVEMPQLEGLSLAREVRELRPELPIIVYSSIGDPGMKERAKDVKADVHVTKLNIEELLQSVARLLEKGK